MSEIPNNKNVTDGELDLLELFRRIGKSLKDALNALMRAFLISLVFMLRRWLPLGLSILAGIVISYFLKSASPSFYASDIVIRNNLVQIDKRKHRDNSGTTSEMISKINKLQTILKNNSDGFARSISMKPELIKKINDIGAFWIIDLGRDGIPDFVDYKENHNVYDSINIRIPELIDIRVNIRSTVDLSQLRDGIIKYIESDSLNQQRNRLRIKQNNELFSRYTFDIQELDSLQKVKYFEEPHNTKPGKDGQIVFMQDQKTQLVYPDIHTIYAKKQQLETEVDLYKGIVTVISDFSLPTRRENGAMYYGRNLIPVLFLITLLLLIILANRQGLRDLFKKY